MATFSPGFRPEPEANLNGQEPKEPDLLGKGIWNWSSKAEALGENCKLDTDRTKNIYLFLA